MSYENMFSDLMHKLGDRTEIFKKAYSLASAVVSGDKISEDRIKARLAICIRCPLANRTYDPPKCSICGCKLKGDSSITNLVAYEETAQYGCKHPEGSQWKKAGV